MTNRLATRSLLVALFATLLLCGRLDPAFAEPAPQNPSTETQGSGTPTPKPNEVVLSSGAKATLQVTPVAVVVEVDTIEKSYVAKNPFKTNVTYKLDILKSKVGEHLVAQVTDGESIHAWVLAPEETGLRLLLELSDVQTLQLAGDLVMTGNVRAVPGGKSTVGSRIYRYDQVSGEYKATATPSSGPGGGAYAIPPGFEEDESDDHGAAQPSNWVETARPYLYPSAAVLAVALLTLLAAILIRRRGVHRPAAPSPTGTGTDLAALAAEVRSLRLQLGSQTATGEGPLVSLSEQEKADLLQHGFTNPVADLIQSLEGRSDLVPFPPASGGSVTFVSPSEWVIAHQWVVARFHDGRGEGTALCRYRISGGAIEWTLLDIQRD